MGAKHTPGPWDWCEAISPPPDSDGDYEPLVVYQVDGDTIAYPDDGLWDQETAHANARLIAAAPDLLAACDSVARKLTDLEHFDPAACYLELRLAIGKAVSE